MAFKTFSLNLLSPGEATVEGVGNPNHAKGKQCGQGPQGIEGRGGDVSGHAKHFQGQGVVLSGNESRANKFVVGEGKGEDGNANQPWKNQRQHDFPKGGELTRA